MGNHEFCESCHESDFHFGGPCDPEKVKKVQAEETALERVRIQELEKLLLLQTNLEGLGFECRIEDDWPRLIVRAKRF